MKMRFIGSIILLVLFLGTAHAIELTVGIIPEQNVFKQFQRYKPLGEYIQEKTDIKITFTSLPRYGNIIDNFKTKKMDAAFWGSFTGALAIEKAGVRPIVRPVNLDGTSSYKGYIFVHKDSVIDNVTSMRFKVIAFVDRATTAGYLLPLAYFNEQGVKNLGTYFKESFFAGSHEAAIFAVLNKEADVGCAKNTIFDLLARSDPRVKENLVILATSPEVPSNGFGLRNDIPADIRHRLRNVFLKMDKDPEGIKVLNDFGIKRFIETTESDYESVIDLAKRAKINLKTYDYMN
jgi:phosphonate transport system substrate-binding protein